MSILVATDLSEHSVSAVRWASAYAADLDTPLHIAYIIDHCLKNDVRTVEASEAAETDWVRTIHESALDRAQFQLECTPGYYNNEGKPEEGHGWFGGPYGGGAVAFFAMLEEWRKKGDLEGLELI